MEGGLRLRNGNRGKGVGEFGPMVAMEREAGDNGTSTHGVGLPGDAEAVEKWGKKFSADAERGLEASSPRVAFGTPQDHHRKVV